MNTTGEPVFVLFDAGGRREPVVLQRGGGRRLASISVEVWHVSCAPQSINWRTRLGFAQTIKCCGPSADVSNVKLTRR